MAEQFRLEQLLGNCPAIDGNEGLVMALAPDAVVPPSVV